MTIDRKFMGNRITDQSSRAQFFQLDRNPRDDNRQNPSSAKSQPELVKQNIPQQATFEFEGNMRRFQLAQTLAVRNAAVQNQTSSAEYLPKKITFTPTELGAFAKKGKLPTEIVVDESYFEQKLFNSYGLDQFNPQDQAILQNIFGKNNPADAINWTNGGKPTQKFTAVLNAQGQYEINFELQKDTDKKLNQALFNKVFFPSQPMDLSLLKMLGVNAKSNNYEQTAENPDLTELALDLTQMGLDVVGIFEPTPFADLTNTGISALRGNWGDAALSVIGVVPYVGDLAKLGKIPKWLKAIDKISNAIDKFGDIVRNGRKGKEAVEAFMKKAKDLLDKIPFDKLPDSLRDGFKSLKKKIDDFFASVKKTDNPADNINPMVKNGDEINDASKTVPTNETDNAVPTKQPEIEPPQKPGKNEKPSQPVQKGKLEIEPGRTLSESEQRFADKMIAEGKNVKARKESTVQGEKNPDFEIDGEIVEYKYVSDLKGKDADKLSAGLSRRILDGGSQASKVSLEVTDQAGMTKEIAERAVRRAFGNQAVRGVDKIKEVRIYGKDFDITLKFETPN